MNVRPVAMVLVTCLASSCRFSGPVAEPATAGEQRDRPSPANRPPGATASTNATGDPREPPPAFAVAIHGGAGSVGRNLDPVVRRAYVAGLSAALREGCDALARGASSLDVVEHIVRALEDDPHFNAGRGAVLTREGRHELDASIMDGRDLSSGAVAIVTTVQNPIALARAVMQQTPHVLLAGEGAEAFAEEIGMEPVPNEHFSTEASRGSLRRGVAREGPHGTVGAVALDRHGDLAAATSTGGLTAKRWGRIGDSPIIGAGTYADNRTCAVSSTGTGEEFIRHAVAYSISARMRLAGESIREAAEAVVHRTLRPGDGGVIAVSHSGEIALEYSTEAMLRGACDARGRFEVSIWDQVEPI